MGWFCSLLFALSLSLENISRVDNVLKRLYVACAPMVGHLSNSMISVSKIKKTKQRYHGVQEEDTTRKVVKFLTKKKITVSNDQESGLYLQILKDFSRLPSRHFSRFALCRLRASHVEDLPGVLELGLMRCPLEKSVLWI